MTILEKGGLPAEALAKAGVPQWTILEPGYQAKAVACKSNNCFFVNYTPLVSKGWIMYYPFVT